MVFSFVAMAPSALAGRTGVAHGMAGSHTALQMAVGCAKTARIVRVAPVLLHQLQSRSKQQIQLQRSRPMNPPYLPR